MRILIVEDNQKMARFLQQGLQEAGYRTSWAPDVAQARDHLFEGEYDLAVLDLMLPDEDGLVVCRELRRQKSALPILVLSALSAIDEKVAALDAGADDYLTKPFDFDELLARVRALLRRGQGQEGSTLRHADVEMDLLGRKVTRDGEPVALTKKEFSLLEYLMRHPERVLSRAQIGEHVWEMDFANTSNVIDVYIGLLRRKIDRDFEPKLIHTVIGQGYYFGTEPPAH
ncbi:MAG: response regulator transcription factor [Planctomycetota bacterium]